MRGQLQIVLSLFSFPPLFSHLFFFFFIAAPRLADRARRTKSSQAGKKQRDLGYMFRQQAIPSQQATSSLFPPHPHPSFSLSPRNSSSNEENFVPERGDCE